LPPDVRRGSVPPFSYDHDLGYAPGAGLPLGARCSVIFEMAD